MIRYKEKEFQQWSICPATGDIFDAKTGEVQPVKIYTNGRPYFKNMLVYQIMAHTFFGYKPDYDVHHKDENPLNNSLSNLVYLTRSEHSKLHAGELLHEETRLKISKSNKGKPKSKETRLKLSAALKGKNKGKPKSEEFRLKMKGNTRGFKKRRGKDKGVEISDVFNHDREVERS